MDKKKGVNYSTKNKSKSWRLQKEWNEVLRREVRFGVRFWGVHRKEFSMVSGVWGDLLWRLSMFNTFSLLYVSLINFNVFWSCIEKLLPWCWLLISLTNLALYTRAQPSPSLSTPNPATLAQTSIKIQFQMPVQPKQRLNCNLNYLILSLSCNLSPALETTYTALKLALHCYLTYL